MLDVTENVVLKQDSSRVALLDFINHYDFCDLWRSLNLTVREFSRMQMHLGSLRQSRIDLCLVRKSLLFLFSTVSHNLNFVSDHVFFEGRYGDSEEREGWWCMAFKCTFTFK